MAHPGNSYDDNGQWSYGTTPKRLLEVVTLFSPPSMCYPHPHWPATSYHLSTRTTPSSPRRQRAGIFGCRVPVLPTAAGGPRCLSTASLPGWVGRGGEAAAGPGWCPTNRVPPARLSANQRRRCGARRGPCRALRGRIVPPTDRR